MTALKQIDEILKHEKVELKSICTHFPDLTNKKETYKHHTRFLELKSNITQFVPLCFGGSGVINYPFQFDMIRVGIAMYGYEGDFRPVEKLISHVVKVSFVKKGEKIGYGEKYTAETDGFYAVVPVGYGDGLPRNISEKFWVEIGEKKYQSVGNICMDCFFVGVDKTVSVGDEVIVMQNAYDISTDTICYETLTRFSNFRGETIVQ